MLIADWERTIKAGQPRPLPRKPCVEDILAGYLKAVKKSATKKAGPLPIATEFGQAISLKCISIVSACVSRISADRQCRKDTHRCRLW